MIVFDTEVFMHDFMFVFADLDKAEFTTIINDNDAVRDYYQKHKNYLYCGYNSRGYDVFTYKAALLDFNLYEVSDFIINKRQKGWMFSGAFRDIKINCFDVMTSFHSLKTLEGFMGSSIQETSIPFDIDRPLTEEELHLTEEYCRHDVEQTIEVLMRRMPELQSHLGLIKEFKLPLHYIEKTKAQLSAIILGARKQKHDDEWNLQFPDTLRLKKYKHIEDWYRDESNYTYDKSLSTIVEDVPFEFGWGGLHGAIPNYIGEGIFVVCDVASLYPAIMIEYDYLSRNIMDKNKFREIRDKRLEYKAVKDPRQAPLKIVLNSTYGALLDRFNPLYDPVMAHNVCLAGQLLMLDLIEHLGPWCQIIQANTDSVTMRVQRESEIDKLKEIAAEWEARTRLDLEWETFTHIWQKDVNGYLILYPDGKIKTKGAYVKQSSDLDNDLAIVNKAVIEYFVNGIDPETTIGNCDRLIDFQKISKIGAPYAYGMYGDERIKERVIRTFASRARGDKGAFKVKINDEGEHRPAKIENTAPRCRIVNEDIVGLPVPTWVDKTWYIDMAHRRIKDFLGVDG